MYIHLIKLSDGSISYTQNNWGSSLLMQIGHSAVWSSAHERSSVIVFTSLQGQKFVSQKSPKSTLFDMNKLTVYCAQFLQKVIFVGPKLLQLVQNCLKNEEFNHKNKFGSAMNHNFTPLFQNSQTNFTFIQYQLLNEYAQLIFCHKIFHT